MSRALKTAIVGFGRIAAGYADDPVMARHYRYASHVQVLADHEAFELVAVVDPDVRAREVARTRWGAPVAVGDCAALGPAAQEVEVLVLATPPETRLAALEAFPQLRAVLVEKPLGIDLAAGAQFLEACRARGILVQVNLWRRSDERLRALAAGELEKLVGSPQGACGVYGNGVLNNGIHMVDLTRMLLGEVAAVEVIGRRHSVGGPIAEDTNPAFALELAGGAVVTFLPLDFSEYRENGLDVWGTAGRLAILNEGLSVLHYPRADNRAMRGEREIACDAPGRLESTVGLALFHMFTNIADALAGRAVVLSPGDSALRSSAVVEAVRRSERGAGRVTQEQMNAWLSSAPRERACT